MEDLIRTLCLILGLVIAEATRADANIAAGNRIPNSTSGQCVWASLETCARHQEIKRLYSLTKYHKSGAGPSETVGVLRSKKISFKQQRPGNLDDTILREAAEEDCPVAIGLGYRHMVTFLGFAKDGRMRIIDSNHPRKVRRISRQAWDGWVIVLLGVK